MNGVVFLSADLLKTSGQVSLDNFRRECIRVKQWLMQPRQYTGRSGNVVKWKEALVFAMDLEPLPKCLRKPDDDDGEWEGPHQPEEYLAALAVARSVFRRECHRHVFTGHPNLACNMRLGTPAMPNLYPRKGNIQESMASARKVIETLRVSTPVRELIPMVSPFDKVAEDTFAWAPDCASAVLEVCRAAGVTDAAVWLPSDSKISGFNGDPVTATLNWMELEKAA